ncbi:MAG: hypothetical protein EOO10_07675 [Chitinophagaceae bacterium]|nr:MAG: hypothetical protein EOO10_07675 [Chitinophagaceae bacterium]
MKFILIAAIAALPFSNKTFKKNITATNCFKGRLEIKGICSNYTIKLVEGKLDDSMIVANWKDDVTGKTHTNVFALGSPCTFPATLNEGDEFYFTIDTTRQQCAVCMAYYPKPEKSLSIKVLDKPCN